MFSGGAPFRVGRYRKSEELESNFSRNSSTWILVCASSWALTSGASGLEALELADKRLYLWCPQEGRITATPTQSWSSKGGLPKLGMIYIVLGWRDCEHHLNKDLCFPPGKAVASHSENKAASIPLIT